MYDVRVHIMKSSFIEELEPNYYDKKRASKNKQKKKKEQDKYYMVI